MWINNHKKQTCIRICFPNAQKPCTFCFCSENGMPVLVLKDQKDIALEITVTNNPSDIKNPQKDGEDAYEAKLIATFPDSLTYSAFREMRGYPVSIFKRKNNDKFKIFPAYFYL